MAKGPTNISKPAASRSTASSAPKTAAKPAAAAKTAKPTVARTATQRMAGAESSRTAARQPKTTGGFRMPEGLLKKAESWSYKTFGGLRRRLNKELATDPTFLKSPHATAANLAELKAGRNMHAPKGEAAGKNGKMQYDHIRERREAKGAPKAVRDNVELNPRNLKLRSPKSHAAKITYRFNTAGQAPLDGSPNLARPQAEASAAVGRQLFRKPTKL